MGGTFNVSAFPTQMLQVGAFCLHIGNGDWMLVWSRGWQRYSVQLPHTLSLSPLLPSDPDDV